MSALIRKTIIPERAYAAVDVDNPGSAVLAVAWKADDGWRVGVDGGRTVADRLTKTRALNLMHIEADRLICRAATRALLAGAA